MKFFSPPNQMTFLRILLTPVFLFLLFSQNILFKQLSILVFFLATITDWYDGWLARRWGYVTRWGAFFDPFADKVLTSSAFFAFAFLNLIPLWMVWIIVVRDIVITLLRSYAEYKGKPIDTSKLAKTKTFSQYIILYYLLILYIAQHTPELSENFGEFIQILFNYYVIYVVMIIITTITLWTGLVYIYDNWKIIRELYDLSNKVTESE